MIPAILHRVVPEVIPEEFEAFWVLWAALHPTWELRTWSDPLNPDDWETGRRFAECLSGAQLAGLVRLEVLWRYGGVFVDWDFEPLRPIDELRAHPAFIGTEDGEWLTDALIGAEPAHPGIRACLDAALVADLAEGASATGPKLVTRTLEARPDVTVLAARMLYPYHYSEPHRRHERFVETVPEAFAVHHWAYSWEGT